jgi:hypothetical protein
MSAPKEINGLPWLFEDALAEWVAWQNRIAAFENEIAAKISILDGELTRSPIRASTKKRLGLLRAASIRQRETVRQLLKPFYPFDSKLYDVTLALRGQVPGSQGLVNYTRNVLRDWGPHAKAENDLMMELVLPLLGERNFNRALVPGSGAGRFPYDLHQTCSIGETTALDHNPFLSVFAHEMSKGSTLEWVDFPQSPSSLESAAAIETCRAPAPSRPGLHFAVGSVLSAPSGMQDFDLILTPWLVDVIPESFDRFALRMNSLLLDAGEWINFGPLGFSDPNPGLRFSFTEIKEVLLESGFEILNSGEMLDTPYLSSPHASGSRRETLFWFHARKVKAHAAPKPHVRLPDWILDPSRPVPALPKFKQTAESSLVFAEVCSQVDGSRSIRDIAGLIAAKYGMPAQSAELALKKYFADQHPQILGFG